jgi:hypothetical protein
MQIMKIQNQVFGSSVVALNASAAAPGVGLKMHSDDNALTQYFVFFGSGQIASALNSSVALSAASDGSVTLQPGNPNDQNQIWVTTDNASTLLTNVGVQRVLTLSLQGAVSVQPVADRPETQTWSIVNGFDCDYLITTLNNATSNNLYVTVSDSLEGVCSISGKVPLAAKSSLVFWTQYDGGLLVPLQIWDPSYSSSNSVVSFDAHQKGCRLSAHEPWIDEANWVDGYKLATDVKTGSRSDGTPGTVTATITR